MFLLINIVGIFAFLGVGVLISKNRRAIPWRTVTQLLILNLIMAGFLNMVPIGREIVRLAAEGFSQFINIAFEGIRFALPNWVDAPQMNFITAALLPLLMIVPVFDILTYIGFLPFVIRWIGRGLSIIGRTPKFESFYAIEMMFLGNNDALAVSRLQIQNMKMDRNQTLAMMSMSCVSAAMVGAYSQLMPAEYVLAAIPLNVINALIVTNILFPVQVAPEDDVIYGLDENKEKPPFFSYLSDSIMNAGRLVFIVTCSVITFVALAALINAILGVFHPALSLENILGCIMFPFAWLLGLPVDEAFQLAQYMGKKLITNEFVVMLDVKDYVLSFSPHLRAVLTMFVTSFANFGTIGIIVGIFKGLLPDEKAAIISRNVLYMMLSGILVSLLTAALGGLFIW
ncbi:MAG: NupC/NupG family nucleoside CNT transporter [Selenomonadaceae bacterium]|nr:NupC/NupG family nucleoside CNT transporter [Selenomonadaceae bacterium]